MGEHEALWVDREYDRGRADGSSRYAERVRHNVAAFDESWGDIAPVTFACAAWRLATAPPPPWVRWHRRILPVAPLPAQLTTSREWWRDRGWRDWPQTFGQYLEPTDRDLTRSPFLRTTLVIDTPVPLGALPPAPSGPSETLADTARLAVTVLVKELNELLNPIIRRLETAPAPG